jgi:outer membrane lipoprotein LolB
MLTLKFKDSAGSAGGLPTLPARTFLLGCACLMIAGCAGVRQPSSTAPTAPKQTWEGRYHGFVNHYVQVNNIQSWTIKGSTSIQHDNKTEIASLTWTQQFAQYNISLFGPLSLGRVTISGAPGMVTLTQSNKPTVSATSPEQLMQKQLGWHLPIANFYYWVRGIAAPTGGVAGGARVLQDPQNHALQIVQQGWKIQYADYMTVQGVDLPRKIDMTNSRLHIRVVIRSWVIGSP